MDARELILEECRATWRAEAHVRAVKEAEADRLDPGASAEYERYIKSHAETHYLELEKLGMENIKQERMP